MKKNVLWIVLAVVLIVGAGVGGYFFGVEQGKAQAANVRERFIAERFGATGQAAQGTPGAIFQGGAGRTGALGRGATGTIKAINGNTLVVSTAQQELKVQVTADTRITLTTQGSLSDLRVGDRIIIGGETQGDTMTATQIQIIPETP
ncbi:MAG: hypothetical protein H5T65_08370 [Chloroflexi bacterium]|nr:hypothetical protein [Chloroflexota bacterium]